MTALGFWHLFQCSTSPKLAYMPRWKRYLEKLPKADLTANKFCERTSSDSAGFLLKFTKLFSKSLLWHLFLCSSSFSTPKTLWIFTVHKYRFTLLLKCKTSIALNVLFPNFNLKFSFVYWKTGVIHPMFYIPSPVSVSLSKSRDWLRTLIFRGLRDLWFLIYVNDFHCFLNHVLPCRLLLLCIWSFQTTCKVNATWT